MLYEVSKDIWMNVCKQYKPISFYYSTFFFILRLQSVYVKGHSIVILRSAGKRRVLLAR